MKQRAAGTIKTESHLKKSIWRKPGAFVLEYWKMFDYYGGKWKKKENIYSGLMNMWTR